MTDGMPYKQLVVDLRADNTYLREENAELLRRRAALLELVADLSRNALSVDEANEVRAQVASLIAEVGTLRAVVRRYDFADG